MPRTDAHEATGRSASASGLTASPAMNALPWNTAAPGVPQFLVSANLKKATEPRHALLKNRHGHFNLARSRRPDSAKVIRHREGPHATEAVDWSQMKLVKPERFISSFRMDRPPETNDRFDSFVGDQRKPGQSTVLIFGLQCCLHPNHS